MEKWDNLKTSTEKKEQPAPAKIFPLLFSEDSATISFNIISKEGSVAFVLASSPSLPKTAYCSHSST